VRLPVCDASAAGTGIAMAAEAAEAARRPEWQPRPFPESWWQARQSRDALTGPLLGVFTDPDAGRARDKARRRGLTRLLDWLQRQPGGTWQEKWLTSGADAAGAGWTDLPLKDRVPAREHHREELCTGLVLLVAGQVIRPGISSLRLEPAVAQAWKERLAHIRDADGRPVRPRVNFRSELVFVRAFYQDIARWAADDPARWAPWVAPCPVKAAECATKKSRSRVKSRMDQRTRAQLPLLPALLRAVSKQRTDAKNRITIARSTPAGALFTAGGQRSGWYGSGGASAWARCWPGRPSGSCPAEPAPRSATPPRSTSRPRQEQASEATPSGTRQSQRSSRSGHGSDSSISGMGCTCSTSAWSPSTRSSRNSARAPGATAPSRTEKNAAVSGDTPRTAANQDSSRSHSVSTVTPRDLLCQEELAKIISVNPACAAHCTGPTPPSGTASPKPNAKAGSAKPKASKSASPAPTTSSPRSTAAHAGPPTSACPPPRGEPEQPTVRFNPAKPDLSKFRECR